MQFEYYSFGAFTPSAVPVSLTDLAKYPATEWLPGTPNAIANGLTSIFSSLLLPEWSSGRTYWSINPDIDRVDRQWKGATSWVIGIAFARYVAEQEGYQWWAPVSAFRGDEKSGYSTTGNWIVGAPIFDFAVNRKTGNKTRLTPDYVLCRLSDTGSYEFAFMEAKGNKRKLDNRPNVPDDWGDQVNSVDLYYRKLLVPMNRRIVVATRIHPTAVRMQSRRIVVRAWNHKEQNFYHEYTALAHFLAVHYAGLCQRLGLVNMA